MLMWLGYAWVMSLALHVAAVLLERGVRSAGMATRFVWLTAMLLTPLALLQPWFREAGPQVGESATMRLTQVAWIAQLDRPLLALWLLGTLALCARVWTARRAVVRSRRDWREFELDGTRVLVSQDVGPGVITLGRAQIVVPTWAMQLDPALRGLLIEHEREHVRAHDHWLMLSGLGLLLLFPINPFLWWQYARLKLAIEMDCDARVLSGRQDVRRYAALLLDVGRRCRSNRLAFAAFAAPPHAIERRIRMILDPKSGARRWLVVACTASAIGVIVLACQTPEPASPEVAVREALGIVPEPPPPPPAAGEIGAGPFQAFNKVNGSAYSVEEVERHAELPRKLASQRAHGVLLDEEKRMPPPPPPAPRRVR